MNMNTIAMLQEDALTQRMTILDYHLRTSYSLCLLRLISKGKTSSMSFKTTVQGQDQLCVFKD